MSIKNRITDLERAAGMTSDGCAACAGKEVFPVLYERDGVRDTAPVPATCPRCGRDLATPIIVVYANRGTRLEAL